MSGWGIWLAGIGTLALWSLIYRENKLYRIFEHLFVGLAAGFTIKYTWSQALEPQWWDPMVRDGQWPWMFAFMFGLLFYTIYSKRYTWMSRLAMSVMMGIVAGQVFQQTANDLVPQVVNTFKPVVNPPIPPGSGLTPVGLGLANLLFVLIVLSVLTYFFFGFEQKNKLVIGTSRTGRLMMMFAFGAIFGSTVMARMALLIDRVWFLMHDWLHLT